MDVKASLTRQYLAGFAMLRDSIQKCPPNLWLAGEHPRTFWRIAYHAIFYTHLYMAPNEESFVPWEKQRKSCSALWGKPAMAKPYSNQDLLDYLDAAAASVSDAVSRLDLDSDSTGFSWYPNMSKFDHQLVNLRHLSGHAGQLSELLMAHGIDTVWVGQPKI